MNQLRETWEDSFLFRWTVANILGWTLGLYFTTNLLRSPLICLGGILAAGGIGLAQWLILREVLPRRWVGVSLAGGAVSILPSLVAALLLVLGYTVYAASFGLILGLSLGAAQWFVLREFDRAGWWIAVNGLGGAVCGLLITFAPIRGLPLGLILGATAFGILTGKTLEWITQAE